MTRSGLESTADLAIHAAGPTDVVAGETSVYTLTLRNKGPGLATGILLTDVLPVGMVPVWVQPAQPGCGWQERAAGCDVGVLDEGDAVTVTLDLSVGGGESLVTGTQVAGISLDLTAPVCAIDQSAVQRQVKCRLDRLPPGNSEQVRVGVGLDPHGAPLLPQPLVHTITVSAKEVDESPADNRTTFTMTVSGAETVAARAPHASTDLAVDVDGPRTVIVGEPFTYTYTIANQGALDATNVRFEDVVPSDLDLVAYAPAAPQCEQRGATLACILGDWSTGESLSFTLVITGYGEQPIRMEVDPLMPGWPVCLVVKERTWQHIVSCELGMLRKGQATRVQLVFVAIGQAQRTTVNAVSVGANEPDLNPLDNTITATISVQTAADPED